MSDIKVIRSKLQSLDAECDRIKNNALHDTGWTKTIMDNSEGTVCYVKDVDNIRYVAFNIDNAIKIETSIQKGGSPIIRKK